MKVNILFKKAVKRNNKITKCKKNMKKKNFFYRLMLVCIILAFSSQCIGKKPSVEFFNQAEAIWPVGKQYEMNVTAGFRTQFEKPGSNKVTLRITGSSLYRIFLNGKFVGHGPARAGHGYYRVDRWDLSGKLAEGHNVLAIEVAGYNLNGYYLLDQPSFIQAELVSGNRVIAATSANKNDFKVVLINERVQKVPRYYGRRTFIEYYKLEPGYDKWRLIPDDKLNTVECEATGEKAHLVRRVPYPEFKVKIPVMIVGAGEVRTGVKRENYWYGPDRAAGLEISETRKGFVKNEHELNPAIKLQEMENLKIEKVETAYKEHEEYLLKENQFKIFDFGTNFTGFMGAEIEVTRPGRLFLTFDETLIDGDVDFKRIRCMNIITYDLLAPGTYTLESIEPYTFKYLKAKMIEGECKINKIYLREYVNPDIDRASFESSNPRINRIYSAGVETFRQNAVDIFMDCPSRERAGFLYNSFFIARAAMDLSGNTLIEKNFFENFLLPEKFEFLPEGMLPKCYPADHYGGGFMPTFAMWFVIQLKEYLHRSNDRQLVDELEPKVLALIDYFKPFKNNDGLLENLDGNIYLERSKANQFVQDVSYPTNMLFAAILDAAGDMYGRESLKQESSAIRETIREQAFNGEFFVDNAVRNEQEELVVTENTSEICQYFAFYFDIASPESHPELWDKLVNEFGPERIYENPYPKVYMGNKFKGNYFRLELLSRYNLRSQMLDESIDFFDYQAAQTGTLWANLGIDDQFDFFNYLTKPNSNPWEDILTTQNLNHGYTSHIVHVLYRDVLGITDIDINNKKVSFRIPDIDLSFCKGAIPLDDEIIEFEWKKEGETVIVKHNVPKGFGIDIQNDTKYNIE